MECFENLDGNIIVCDNDGVIIYMNKTAILNYTDEGGKGLIGRNLMDCHNQRSKDIIQHILETGEKNVYTIEKKGKKKIVYQSPWLVNGEIKGIVELSLEIPFEMPHYVR